MPNIKLVSSDGKAFSVDTVVANRSGTVRGVLDTLGVNEEDGKEDEVPILNVHSDILEKVIEFATYHKDDPLSDQEQRSDDMSEWDADFVKVDQAMLFELVLAANYLDMKDLLDLCCKAIANTIKGKTPQEIRKTFNITQDFSEEELQMIQKENQWSEGN